MGSTTTSLSRRAGLPVAIAICATALWCFVFAKAGLSSMTHDEASTWFHHQGSRFFTCLYSPECWKSANNHLLNTLLWQQTTRWLGPTELGMRLPNILAGVVFLASSAFLVLQFTARFWPGLAAFALLTFNPFLLDFFALARGYGLCAAFIMAAIALWYVYWKQNRPLYLLWSCAALTAAILSNFVALNVFAAIGGATFLLTLKGDRRFFLRSMAILGGMALLLALILHRPIQFLRKGGEFQYGTNSLWESLESLVKNPLYGNAYLGDATSTVFTIVIITAMLGLLVYSWLRMVKGKEESKGTDRFFAAAGLAFVLSVATMIAQHYLLGSVYLINRTSTPLMPLLGAFFGIGLLLLAKEQRWATVLAVLVFMVMSWNLVRSANVRFFREWWYDENTKAVMLYANDVGNARQQPVRLGVSWLFFPAGEFYRITLSLNHVEPLPNNQDIRTDAGYDYYYIEESQKSLLGDAYEQEKYYPWGRVLMRKKPLHTSQVAQ